MNLSRLLLAPALLASSATALAAGTLSYASPENEGHQQLEIGASAVRMSQQGQPQWLLYQDADKTLYIVDDTQRSYNRVTEQAAEALAKQVATLQKQIEQQLAMLPPEQREMMKGMLPQVPDMSKRNFRVEKSQGTRTVGKYTCQPVTVYDNDKASEELCLADVSAVGLKAADLKLLKRMGETMSAMASQFGAGSMAAVLDQMDGVPVEHRAPGAKQAKATLVKVDTAAPDAARLSLPEGYSERPLFPGMN